MPVVKGHETVDYVDHTAFMAIASLIDKGITTHEGIADPILRYLAKRYEDLKGNRLPKAEFDNWLHGIVLDFDIQINLEYHNDDFIQASVKTLIETTHEFIDFEGNLNVQFEAWLTAIGKRDMIKQWKETLNGISESN